MSDRETTEAGADETTSGEDGERGGLPWSSMWMGPVMTGISVISGEPGATDGVGDDGRESA